MLEMHEQPKRKSLIGVLACVSWMTSLCCCCQVQGNHRSCDHSNNRHPHHFTCHKKTFSFCIRAMFQPLHLWQLCRWIWRLLTKPASALPFLVCDWLNESHRRNCVASLVRWLQRLTGDANAASIRWLWLRPVTQAVALALDSCSIPKRNSKQNLMGALGLRCPCQAYHNGLCAPWIWQFMKAP